MVAFVYEFLAYTISHLFTHHQHRISFHEVKMVSPLESIEEVRKESKKLLF